ncbi:unnamed protein product [Closterium sp. NIES-54]
MAALQLPLTSHVPVPPFPPHSPLFLPPALHQKAMAKKVPTEWAFGHLVGSFRVMTWLLYSFHILHPRASVLSPLPLPHSPEYPLPLSESHGQEGADGVGVWAFGELIPCHDMTCLPSLPSPPDFSLSPLTLLFLLSTFPTPESLGQEGRNRVGVWTSGGVFPLIPIVLLVLFVGSYSSHLAPSTLPARRGLLAKPTSPTKTAHGRDTTVTTAPVTPKVVAAASNDSESSGSTAPANITSSVSNTEENSASTLPPRAPAHHVDDVGAADKEAPLKGVGAGATGKGAVKKGAAGKGATGNGAAGKGGAGATAAGKGAANKGAAGKGAPGKVAEGEAPPSKAAEGKGASDASAADKGAAKKGAAGKSATNKGATDKGATNAQHAAPPHMAAPHHTAAPPHMATAEDVAIHTLKTASTPARPAGSKDDSAAPNARPRQPNTRPHNATAEDVEIHTVKTASNAQRVARPHMATAEDVAIVHPGSEKATAKAATVAPMRAAEREARPHMATAEDVAIHTVKTASTPARPAGSNAAQLRQPNARPHMATAEDVAIHTLTTASEIHPAASNAQSHQQVARPHMATAEDVVIHTVTTASASQSAKNQPAAPIMGASKKPVHPHKATAEDVAIHTVKKALSNHPAGSNAQRAVRPHMATAEDVAIHTLKTSPGNRPAASNAQLRQPSARPHMATAEDVVIIHPGSAKATAAVVAPMQAEKGEAWRNVVADDDNDDNDRENDNDDENDRKNDNDGDKENDNDRDGDRKNDSDRVGDNEKDNDNDAVQWHGGESSSTRRNGGSKGQRRGRTHGSDKGASSRVSRFSNSRGWEPRSNQRTGLDKAQQFRMATSSDVAITHRSGIQGANRGVNYGSGLHKAPQFRMATSSDVILPGSGTQGTAKGAPSRVSRFNNNNGWELEDSQRTGLHKAQQFRMATSSDVAIHRSGVQGSDRGVNYGNERLGAQGEGGDCNGDNNSGGNGGDNGGENANGRGGGGPIDIGAILEVHNAARREVGVADLAWDNGVAAAAQEWADQLAAAGCPLQHGGAEGLGQNLYWRAPAGLTPEEDRMAVQAWVDEKADWTPSPVPEGCVEGRMCGHYTQVVWAGTTHVGCASAQCPDGGGMWVCDYSPQGNIIGSTPF